MDNVKRAANIIKLIYAKRNGENVNAELVKQVCDYYDVRKNEDLKEGDLRFLRYIASEAGVPQYYDMLDNFHDNIIGNIEDVHLYTIPVIAEESSLYTSENVYLHKYQKEVVDRFQKDERNRFFLSASTSFGKTFLIYEIIRKMQYDNIVLIFPTIALLSENIYKIFGNPAYEWVKNMYKVHTLSDTELQSHHNLFIYTPERFLSFLDKHGDFHPNFFFVDEVYKIDNEFLVDDEQRENERDVAYRISTHIGLENTADCLLAGPYINIDVQNQQSSIVRFLDWAHIELLDYNNLEIVSKREYELKSKKRIVVEDVEQPIIFTTAGKEQRVKELVKYLVSRNENVIVYCPSKSEVEKYAKLLLEDSLLENVDTTIFSHFLNHLDSLFNRREGANWIVSKALKKGIGVHHGLVPKYIQNEIINLFNQEKLHVLVVTTTITEGVNTTAKNMIVLSHKKGIKELKTFDAKNIEGRAGRFIHHYVGRVFIFDAKFKEIVDSEEQFLRHKFFDVEIPKSPVDFPYIEEQYLSLEDANIKRTIDALKERSNIPEAVLECYKTISPEDKCYLYETLRRLSESEKSKLHQLISYLNGMNRIYKPGFDVICEKIKPIAKGDIVTLIDLHRDTMPYCMLTYMVSSYFANGFVGAVNYYLGKNNHIDDAVKKSAKFVFTTLRYQVVKYVGLFNLCYKHIVSLQSEVPIEKVHGFDKLLMRMEYSAETTMGRKASDAGASFRVIAYYDKLSQNPNTTAYNDLDEFEKNNADNIRDIVNS
jgi:late competence protein required for DNA uptake (superfamily II DNA/RNA helicase)